MCLIAPVFVCEHGQSLSYGLFAIGERNSEFSSSTAVSSIVKASLGGKTLWSIGCEA
jgi:hypothetical protein